MLCDTYSVFGHSGIVGLGMASLFSEQCPTRIGRYHSCPSRRGLDHGLAPTRHEKDASGHVAGRTLWKLCH